VQQALSPRRLGPPVSKRLRTLPNRFRNLSYAHSRKRWGILELKIGSGSADADLAQLYLYHEMLQSVNGSNAGRLMLWHFQPQLEHTHLSSEQLEPVRAKLRALIGRMAGVVPSGAV
jgi:hypothetical protein